MPQRVVGSTRAPNLSALNSYTDEQNNEFQKILTKGWRTAAKSQSTYAGETKPGRQKHNRPNSQNKCQWVLQCFFHSLCHRSASSRTTRCVPLSADVATHLCIQRLPPDSSTECAKKEKTQALILAWAICVFSDSLRGSIGDAEPGQIKARPTHNRGNALANKNYSSGGRRRPSHGARPRGFSSRV